jgi:S-adenosylmethionine:tRNA ribosyltransferase-isomerase
MARPASSRADGEDAGLPTSAFDYALPPGLIASVPAERRDESRLLLLDRRSGSLAHRRFRDIATYIGEGDALVLNETRVLRARLLGRKPTGGRAEVLLLHPAADNAGMETDTWTALVRPGAKLRPGAVVEVATDFSVEIGDAEPDGSRTVRLRTPLGTATALERHGRVPLPPYIAREPTDEDAERYQTVYARVPGSVAAPTAGLHFSPGLVGALEDAGVRIARLVLHVGAGTFRPVEVEDPRRHPMHAEWYRVEADAARAINETRDAGRRVWAVGTTVVRTLETLADEAGRVEAGEGRTRLFIRPPWRFRTVDRLLTNFHLPRSTLLMLVAAFAGHDLVMRAYREAIRERYRFYSYGDAMGIL